MPKLLPSFLTYFFASLLLFLFPSSTCCAQVVINEFLSSPNPEWVELYNSSDSAEYLKEYYLDDDLDFSSDAGSSGKKLLSSLDIRNSAYPFFDLSSFLNNDGDFVVLFRPDGTVVDQHQYSSNPGEGVTIGRSPDATGGFVLLSAATKGAPNASPTPTPTSTPTPTPTLTATSAPTSASNQTPAKTPTPSLKASATAVPKATVADEKVEETGNIVLGLRNELQASVPTTGSTVAEEKGKFPAVAVILIVLGIALVGGSGFVLFKKIGQDNITQGEQENNDGQID